MLFRPPKEFGPRSPIGLTDLTTLQRTNIPFAKSDNGESVAIKGNGFDTVTRKEPLPTSPGRYVSVGRFGSESNDSLVLAGGLRPPFKRRPVSFLGRVVTVVTTIDSTAQLGVRRSVVILEAAPGQFRVSRTRDFTTRQFEVLTSSEVANPGTPMPISLTAASYYRPDQAIPAIEYETVSYSLMFEDDVLPAVIASENSLWYAATMAGYPFFDHYQCMSAQLAPNVHMVVYAVARRGDIYPVGARADASPDGIVPYPLFCISQDCAITYAAYDMSYLYVGSTYQFVYPAVAGTVGTPGLGGYAAGRSTQVLCLAEAVFISFELQVDVPSADSRTVGLRHYEARIFRSYGLNFTSMTRLTVPPGYGTIWDGAPSTAFAQNLPDTGSGVIGMIGYVCFPINANDPALLFVSNNSGDTWEAARPLPANSRYAYLVEAVTDRELSCCVYEATTPPRVVRYGSLDYGVTWEFRQIVAENVRPLGPAEYLDDFWYLIVVNTEDGSLPSPDPMAGWRWDSRIPRYQRV